MSSDPHSSKWARLCGLCLLFVGAFATWYSTRAGFAQLSYFQLKYGSLSKAGFAIQEQVALRADRWYPHNYYLSLLMAEVAWARWLEWPPDEIDQERERGDFVRYWIDRGVSKNPYRRELRWLETQWLMSEDRPAAFARWKDYVNFAFWDPWNIAALIEVAAETGFLEETRHLLGLLHPQSSAYARASEAIERATYR